MLYSGKLDFVSHSRTQEIGIWKNCFGHLVESKIIPAHRFSAVGVSVGELYKTFFSLPFKYGQGAAVFQAAAMRHSRVIVKVPFLEAQRF